LPEAISTHRQRKQQWREVGSKSKFDTVWQTAAS